MTEGQEDRRVRRTRALLRQSLTELLREKELKDITVQELTRRADVNRGTFYRHYTDLYDMADQLERELLEEFSVTLDAYTPQSLREQGLRAILADVFGFIRRNADLCSALVGSQRGGALLERLKAAVYDRVSRQWASAYPLPEAHREQCLAFWVAGVMGLLQVWLAGGGRETAEELAALTEGLILGGLTQL